MAASEKHLVIVESPAKARTIGKYLGRGYEVAASVGHVRDLPTKELGVDVDAGFKPRYVTIRGKGKVLSDLKKRAKGVDSVILATDPDREGEAIAFHVAEQLGFEGDDGRFRRVRFHEITKGAVREALDRSGPIDMRKVEAQQARRILDRLVGYQVSPLLWKPIRPGLSAGRVQTVALRLICEREDAIRAFEEQEYWSITARLRRLDHEFDAKLHKIDGKAFTLEDESAATTVLADVEGVPFRVTDVKRRERRKNPAPPFTTSTLQQAAAKRLRYSAKRTMSLAQRLYEGVEVGTRGAVGLITYMRTDSTRVSAGAAEQARAWVREEIGAPYLPPKPRLWVGKQQKGAQEAHEAIRPTDVTLHPSEAARYLREDAARLYELVWLRFVASQMAPAVYDTTTLDFDLAGASSRSYLFRASGSVVKFAGFTRLYLEATEAGEHRRLDDLEPLPNMASGDTGELLGLEPRQHFTQPPPRFSEASLVKELEEKGIGRPSTYAQILSTLVDRGYADLEKRRFHPTDLGEVVSKLLVKIFPSIFNVEFTSRMESALDRVEEGEVQWNGLLGDFYPRFRERLEAGEATSEEIIKEILAADGEACEKCGQPMLVRWNRFGRFLGCSGYPDCKSTRSLDGTGPDGKELGAHPELSETVMLKSGPYGPYVELPVRGQDKPKRVSLPRGIDPDSVDLEYAVRLLSLPKVIGRDPGTGEEVSVGIGRFGPFVRRGKIYASLGADAQLFELTLEEGLRLIEEKAARKRPIRELGADPESGRDLVILSGRYGPYVTDGKLNATLPKTMEPSDLTLEGAVELLRKKAARKGGARGARNASSTRQKAKKAKQKT